MGTILKTLDVHLFPFHAKATEHIRIKFRIGNVVL